MSEGDCYQAYNKEIQEIDKKIGKRMTVGQRLGDAAIVGFNTGVIATVGVSISLLALFGFATPNPEAALILGGYSCVAGGLLGTTMSLTRFASYDRDQRKNRAAELASRRDFLDITQKIQRALIIERDNDGVILKFYADLNPRLKKTMTLENFTARLQQAAKQGAFCPAGSPISSNDELGRFIIHTIDQQCN